MSELEGQIKVVAKARRIAEIAVGNKKVLVEEWEERYAGFLTDLQLSIEEVSQAEALLRDLTLQAYAETGNKAPAVGVGIREITTYSYDGAEALKWAKEHKLCLKLDDTAFKKQVKATPDDLPFVTSTTEPQATIAKELGKTE